MSTQYTGTLIKGLLKVNGIELDESYTIQQIMDAIAEVPAADLANCLICEGRLKLVPCGACHEFVCMDCTKLHDCNQVDGPNNSDPLRG